MKKIISVLLVGLMLLSALSVTAFAKPTSIYEESFEEKYGEALYYQENYFHTNDDNRADWAYVWACNTMALVDPLPGQTHSNCYINDGVVFHEKDWYMPFDKGYCIYDIANDKFIGITEVDLDAYEDLRDYVIKNDIARMIGDLDGDKNVTIMDATYIQMVVAKLKTEPGENCIADFNRDGSSDIIDATAIQLVLAGYDDSNDELNTDLVYVEYDEVRYPNTYPEKPDEGVLLDYVSKGNSNSYNYTASHLGYPENFMAVIKSKEQYDYVFEGYNNRFTEEFFETHWLVASMTHTSCDEEIAIITSVCLVGDTLYVSVDEYIPGDFGPISPSEPPYISLVAIEKEKLADVTNIVRVK